MNAVETISLNKIYSVKNGPMFRKKRTEIHAVRDVSFSIPEGTIFGLLGPNGAGKTTIIKILATLLLPNSGQAFVFGLNTDSDGKKIRSIISTVLPGDRSLFWKLTVYENLSYFGALYGLYGKTLKTRIEKLLTDFKITDKRNELVERLSTGLRQRVVLCRALLPNPRLLLLDEPTLGLDPVSAKSLREYIQTIRQNGTTILLTTHYMLEADLLADRVAIIKDGSFVANDSPASLKQQFAGSCIVTASIQNITDSFIGGIESIGTLEYRNRDAESDITAVRIRSIDKTNIIARLVSLSQSTSCALHNIDLQEPSLEDAYIALTGTVIGS